MRERGFLEEEVTKAEDVIKIILTPLIVARTEELPTPSKECVNKNFTNTSNGYFRICRT
jgi:cystathionine beta-synthase